ncbi:MAG TPA: OsmC family protein [Bryobacteraceae bacterium]|nr:OsmC family protein [Bryobacteraceae bacterium]
MAAGRTHTYQTQLNWTGNKGEGTKTYTSYSRNHEITGSGKSHAVLGSSDPAFRGEPSRYNPEEFLVASLSACHMLAYLHLCADAGIVVVSYTDAASGVMVETRDTGGHFESVTLEPVVTIEDAGRADEAQALHDRAHHLCFIANSVRFPVNCRPQVRQSDRLGL